MKRNILSLALAIASGALAACAGTQAHEAVVSKEKVYRTGSNLPVGERDRSGVGVVSGEAAQGIVSPPIPNIRKSGG